MEQDNVRILPIRTRVIPNSATVSQILVPLTSFIGREQELTAVCKLLQEASVRLLTLTGPGGVGKTRLVLAVAEQALPNFLDGVFFVSCASIRDPFLILSQIASTLDLDKQDDVSTREQLTAHLRRASVLLLLDNFEHLLPAAPFLVELLQACPSLKILVTSRAVLRVEGEHVFEVLPFTLPEHPHSETTEQIMLSPAVQLFIQRAQAINANFQLTEANCSTIAEICIRLDGLPLAIELAAARINLLTPQMLLHRLEYRLPFLTARMRDVHWRQQTLRNTLQWSYDLLSQQEQYLFRMLSVFSGGCTLDAVEAIYDSGREEVENLLDMIGSLIDKSFVFQSEQADGELRLFMLETIREYGLECLRASEEVQQLCQNHANYFLALAEEAEPKLAGAEQLIWLERLEQEHNNLRAALTWLIESGKIELALRLEGALSLFWGMHNHVNEGHRWLEKVLADRDDIPVPVRAQALYAAGSFSFFRADHSQAEALFEKSLKLFRELDDQHGIVFALSGLGYVALAQHRYTIVQNVSEENLPLAKELGDRWKTAEALFLLTHSYRAQGDYSRARVVGEECLVLAREFGEPSCLAHTIHAVAHVVYKQDELAAAYSLYRESLTRAIDVDDQWLSTACLVGLGEIVAAQGKHIWATRLWGAEEAFHETVRATPVYVIRAPDEALVAATRAHLGEETFAIEWQMGRKMSLKEVLVATEFIPSVSIVPAEVLPMITVPSTTRIDDLTAREVEVLRLLAQGWQDAQIAEHLSISPRTVNTHLTSIYRKLHITTRSAATRYAMDQQLV